MTDELSPARQIWRAFGQQQVSKRLQYDKFW